ncbi:MAG: DUF1616 domain-containing protein [Candidatus Bathyarchaeota archaeon]|nr:DUF1616 domain-containing protein [Candidatus Bathyarchaeota archaeon]
MDFAKYNLAFLVSVAALALFVASPAIQTFLVFPQAELFSEISILGPQQNAADYPSNIKPFENYTVYLEVANNLGQSAYFMVKANLINQTQYVPADFEPLCSLTCFVANRESVAFPLVFSLNYTYLVNDEGLLEFNLIQITLNGENFETQDSSVAWDPQGNEFFGYLTFELWVYDSAAGDFQNSGLLVNLRLNLEV